MLRWRREQVWDYLLDHDLPFNSLHEVGYPSIGCRPCTRPVPAGEVDERAGRWARTGKTECGIHDRPLPGAGRPTSPGLVSLGGSSPAEQGP